MKHHQPQYSDYSIITCDRLEIFTTMCTYFHSIEYESRTQPTMFPIHVEANYGNRHIVRTYKARGVLHGWNIYDLYYQQVNLFSF